MEKCRLDQLLVNKGLVPSREKGKALIMAGQVYVNEVKVEKPGTNVNIDVTIEVKGDALPYVSRGGLKLAKALQEFQIALPGKVVLDIGASTGGFTDCALQNGARKVYAVDVGYGQLAWSLRQDLRVVIMERKNARYLSAADIPELVDVITIDVAFISLRKILIPLHTLLTEDGFILALIKPQFEAGREQIGKKGVVKDSAVHCQVIEEIIAFSQELGLRVRGLTYSPIKGAQGNIEFLLWLQKKSHLKKNIDEKKMKETVKKIVIEAHQKL
ncbi:MAG: TlyA family RNA methyltransferase [Clostridia bacterium]|nr:TlyA family RNA methyltransferase [Clostridia bacterium]